MQTVATIARQTLHRLVVWPRFSSVTMYEAGHAAGHEASDFRPACCFAKNSKRMVQNRKTTLDKLWKRPVSQMPTLLQNHTV